jgi:SAM-dependent methyltransferase
MDEVVFNALIGVGFASIQRQLRWSQGDPDIAYQLADLGTAVHWVKRGYLVWREWREKSLEKLETAEFVLTADISAFYENIDLARLASDVRATGMDDEAARLLRACLNRWAEPRGKGIPQGHTSSDILAKLYLDSVDHNLLNAGFSHLRYVDDIRIFCRDLREAKRALLQLSELLRQRGLNVQSAKTKIYRSDEAIHKIDGVSPVISRINEELREELQAYVGAEYGTVAELEELTAANRENPPVEVLERAFRSHFLDAPDTDFDPTLFHYLLTRLGATGSRTAVDYSLALLSRRPEETEYILRYLTKVPVEERDDERIIEYLETPDALYEYQVFLALRHYSESGRSPARVVAFCRRVLREAGFSEFVKAYAMAIVADAGENADLEFVEAMYPRANDEMQRATIICSCYRMEAGRRNAFFGRARGDGNLVERAVIWARTQEQPPREQEAPVV